MAKALSDVIILDLSRILAGPYATMILGDLGGTVIKVEPPGGDGTRQWGPPFVEGESIYFMSINRNKKSIVLDLKTPEGKETLSRLVKKADVVMENFRPGTLGRLGFPYEKLKELNPKIILCSISGFGQEGRYKTRPGYDFIIQALSGAQDLTGDPEGVPYRFGYSMADLSTGLVAVQAILAALYRRERTGEGARIDLGLLDTMVSLLTYYGQTYLTTGHSQSRMGNVHANIVPYGTFPTGDGYVVLGTANDAFYKKLLKALGREDLLEVDRFKTNGDRVKNRKELTEILEGELRKKTTREWMEIFEREDVPAGPVQTVGEVLEMDYVKERGIMVETHHPKAGKMLMVGSPIQFMGENPQNPSPPPLLGEHTEEILKWLEGEENYE